MINTLKKSLLLSIILCGLLGSANVAFGMEEEDSLEIYSQPNTTLFIQSKTNPNFYKIIKKQYDTHGSLTTITNPTIIPDRHADLSEKNFDATALHIIKTAQQKGRIVLVYSTLTKFGTYNDMLRVETESELQYKLAQEQVTKQSSNKSNQKAYPNLIGRQPSNNKPNSSSPQPSKLTAILAGVTFFSGIALLVAIYGYGFSPTQFFKNLFSNPSATA